MGGSTSLTKKQKLLAGVVCSLIVLELVTTAFYWHPAFGSLTDLTDVFLFVLYVLNFSTNIALLLKFLLPNWAPHKEWLTRLLGASLSISLLGMVLDLATSTADDMIFAFLLPAHRENDRVPVVIIVSLEVIVKLLSISLLNPDFYLLLGITSKKEKRAQKIAGILYAVALPLYVLSVIWLIIDLQYKEPFVWSYAYLRNILTYTGYIIIYLTWPVLSRPILEKPKKEIIYMQEFTFERNTAPKQKPDQNKLGFGNYFTDHMFLMNYDEGEGWHNPRIVPYGPIALEPSAMCLHYGQEVFEGLKAYCGVDGRIRLFRPEENMARLNLSNERLCIPLIDEALAVRAVEELVKVDQDWIPTQDGTSLYIRPFIFAVDPQVGVHPAAHLIFCIILSPVGAYYPEGLNPIKIFVEEKYVRAVKGGLGFTKAAANYASSLKAQQEAQAQGFAQVLWLDGVQRKYIEEVGTMNVFFVLGDEIVTPALQGSILGGITRKSCIDLLRGWGYTVNERPLALEEVVAAAKAGQLKEAFGSGTAAVVSPIGALRCGGETLAINNGQIGAISQRLYDELTGIQWGKVEDTYGWTRIIA